MGVVPVLSPVCCLIGVGGSSIGERTGAVHQTDECVGESSIVRLGLVPAQRRRSFGMSGAPRVVGDLLELMFEDGTGHRWKYRAHTDTAVFVVEELDGPRGVLLF